MRTKLRRWLKKVDESPYAFAARAGIPSRTLYNILDGSGCLAETALRIEDGTDGEVTLRDLVEDARRAARIADKARNL